MQDNSSPLAYTARFWFSGLENAIDFPIIQSDYDRFKDYLSDTEPKEFFEFDTPGETVVLANMVQVDAVKLVVSPGDDDVGGWDEEPSEAKVHLVGRPEPFFASTSEEHFGPDHPIREVLDTEDKKFIHWLDAFGNTVVMNPENLSYVEHPKYWLEGVDEWGDDGDDSSADNEEEEAPEEDSADEDSESDEE